MITEIDAELFLDSLFVLDKYEIYKHDNIIGQFLQLKIIILNVLLLSIM
jgi:hypothetical protein